MKTSSSRWVCLLASLVAASAVSGQNDWPRWRGPKDNGCAEGDAYPVKWSEKDIRWKAPLPGYGCSTPVVWNERIYLTAPAEGKDAVGKMGSFQTTGVH